MKHPICPWCGEWAWTHELLYLGMCYECWNVRGESHTSVGRVYGIDPEDYSEWRCGIQEWSPSVGRYFPFVHTIPSTPARRLLTREERGKTEAVVAELAEVLGMSRRELSLQLFES